MYLDDFVSRFGSKNLFFQKNFDQDQETWTHEFHHKLARCSKNL